MYTWLLIKKFATPDLNSKPKDRVIIRNKNDEYSIVVDVLNNKKLEMQSEKIH